MSYKYSSKEDNKISKYETTNFHLNLESLMHIQGQSKWFTVRDL